MSFSSTGYDNRILQLEMLEKLAVGAMRRLTI